MTNFIATAKAKNVSKDNSNPNMQSAVEIIKQKEENLTIKKDIPEMIYGDSDKKDEKETEEDNPDVLSKNKDNVGLIVLPDESRQALIDDLKLNFKTILEEERKNAIGLTENINKLNDAINSTKDVVKKQIAEELLNTYEEKLNQLLLKIVSEYKKKLNEFHADTNDKYKTIVTNASQNYTRMIDSINNNYKVLFKSYTSPFKLIQYCLTGTIVNVLLSLLLFFKLFM